MKYLSMFLVVCLSWAPNLVLAAQGNAYNSVTCEFGLVETPVGKYNSIPPLMGKWILDLEVGQHYDGNKLLNKEDLTIRDIIRNVSLYQTHYVRFNIKS